ncbi:MAG: hypothetical protein HY720_28730 [Planctomycetes bacterium]|nr:hypothetical protein [Planctomycetota bacterium]
MSSEELRKQFHYFLDHQDELVGLYLGKFVVIQDCQVRGACASDIEAVEEARKKFEPGTFLVQKCIPGEEAYTHTFHSRVALPPECKTGN